MPGKPKALSCGIHHNNGLSREWIKPPQAIVRQQLETVIGSHRATNQSWQSSGDLTTMGRRLAAANPTGCRDAGVHQTAVGYVGFYSFADLLMPLVPSSNKADSISRNISVQ